jgi:acyl-CoA thioester hydrolase
MSSPPTILHCRTRPNDLDSLAHVNHAVTLEFLEAGRWDWFGKHGIGRGGPSSAVVTHVDVAYLQQIFPGELEVATRLATPLDEIAYRAQFRQTITVRDDAGGPALAIDACISVAFVDLATRRLCSMQEFFEDNAIDAEVAR